eukprot:6189973-Pleurochrysis_carterae.AAC.1
MPGRGRARKRRAGRYPCRAPATDNNLQGFARTWSNDGPERASLSVRQTCSQHHVSAYLFGQCL